MSRGLAGKWMWLRRDYGKMRAYRGISRASGSIWSMFYDRVNSGRPYLNVSIRCVILLFVAVYSQQNFVAQPNCCCEPA